MRLGAATPLTFHCFAFVRRSTPFGIRAPPTIRPCVPEYNVPPPDDRSTIVCLYCNRSQEVGRKAMSVTCKFCNKSLRLEDLRFKEYQARRVIDTCGDGDR